MNDDQVETKNVPPNNDNPGIFHSLISKIKNFVSGTDSTPYPKDLTPEDVIDLFDLQPEDIPALIKDEFPGIPPHIKVLNEVHLVHANPEEYYSSSKDEEEEDKQDEPTE